MSATPPGKSRNERADHTARQAIASDHPNEHVIISKEELLSGLEQSSLFVGYAPQDRDLYDFNSGGPMEDGCR